VALRDAVAVEHHLLGEKEKKTYQLALQRDKYEGLQPHEKALVDFLIGDMGADDAVTIEELREGAKHDPKTFREDMQSWKNAVRALGRARGYLEASGTAAAVVSAAGGVALIVVAALERRKSASSKTFAPAHRSGFAGLNDRAHSSKS